MQSTLDMPKSAGLSRQELPGGLSPWGEAFESLDPAHWERGGAAEAGSPEEAPSPVPVPAPTWTPEFTRASLAAEAPAVAGTAHAGAPRVAEAVERAVVTLGRTGRESLEVSISPDPGTEIRLRVSMKDGTTEVHAELARGDASRFAAHWAELQQRMGTQGIRLVSWTSSSANSGWDGASGHGSGRPARHEHDEPLSMNRLPARGPEGRRARYGQGWETWA